MRLFRLGNISIVALVLSAGAALLSATAHAQDIYVANEAIEGSGTIGEYTTTGSVVNPSLVSGLTYNFGIAVSGSNLFVANTNQINGDHIIGEYSTSGGVVNASLVSGLNSNPYGIAVSGPNLFVVTYGNNGGTYGAGVGEYTTSGAVVNPSLVSGLYAPQGIAVAGSNLFVADPPNGTIGEYTTSGAVVNPSLISGLDYPYGIAVSGSNLFITTDNNTVVEYTTSGTVVNPSLISGLNYPHGIAVSGSNLFVANTNAGTIGEYTTSGAVVNPSLISGLSNPYFIALSVPSTVALTAVSNATIITGGTGSLGTTVSNSAVSGASNLNYTLTAAIQTGSGTLGTVTPATDSLAPGASNSCTVPASSTNLGVNTISFTASDPNSSNGSLSSSATLTVLDHSNASLSSTATQKSETINFGNVLRGATIPSRSFTIYNLAANTSAAYTAKMQLTGFSTSGNTAFQTNLANFNGLTAVGGSNGNTFTAALNTGSYMTGSGTISMSASQLVDDSSLPGAGSNNNGGLTITMQGNVGNATADASNSRFSFGPALTAPVAANGSYANLESTVMATTGSGGFGMVGSTATILAGTNSSSGTSQTVSMAWRTQTLGEGLFSDVLDLSGMALSDSSGQTVPFVMQMTYSPGLILSANELPYLGWLNPNTDTWQNAVLGNYASKNDTFVGLGAWNGDMALGDWGVNTSNDTVWAVINHNSDFAVVPESSTIALLGVGAIGMLGYAWRRRKRSLPLACDLTLCNDDETDSQEGGTAILSMPCRWTEAKRRAA
jgi:hypothetical protein